MLYEVITVRCQQLLITPPYCLEYEAGHSRLKTSYCGMQPFQPEQNNAVITSYSIHYTKLYDIDMNRKPKPMLGKKLPT